MAKIGVKKSPLIKKFRSRTVLARSVGEMIREMKLDSLADSIIADYGLAASQGGRQILKLALQRAFLKGLWGYGKRGEIAGPNERAVLGLIGNAETIRGGIWAGFSRPIKVADAAKLYSAVLKIAQKAKIAFGGRHKKYLQLLEAIEKKAKENAAGIKTEMVKSSGGHIVAINEKELLWIAQQGESVIKMLSEKLPADSRTGLALVEKIVKAKLGGKR